MHDFILQGARVLVIEEEAFIALDIEQICDDAGAAEVVIVRTPDEAATEIAGRAFDIVVLDLPLPGETMAGFAADLTARGTPIVATSAYGDVGAWLGPAAVVVEKPFTVETMVTAIAQAMGRRR